MNDQQVSVAELDTDDLQWDTASVRPKEQDKTLPLRVGRVERERAMLHDIARPVVRDPMSNG